MVWEWILLDLLGKKLMDYDLLKLYIFKYDIEGLEKGFCVKVIYIWRYINWNYVLFCRVFV